jgi:hypothetical protein
MSTAQWWRYEIPDDESPTPELAPEGLWYALRIGDDKVRLITDPVTLEDIRWHFDHASRFLAAEVYTDHDMSAYSGWSISY